MMYRVRFSERRNTGATRTLVERDIDAPSIGEAMTWAASLLKRTNPDLLSRVSAVRVLNVAEALAAKATATA
jgi:hypothetical protein